MAGGFSIKVENIEKFKKFINRKFENINEDLKKEKPLYLDSVISSVLLTSIFFKKLIVLLHLVQVILSLNF